MKEEVRDNAIAIQEKLFVYLLIKIMIFFIVFLIFYHCILLIKNRL